jgi:hypothetical protein
MLGLSLACGCADVSVVVAPPWPDDAHVVLIAVDDAGEVLPPTPAILPPRAVHEVAVEGDARVLYVRRYERLDTAPECTGASLGTDGVPAGPVLDAWRGDLVDGEVAWNSEAVPMRFDVRLLGCEPPPSCTVVGTVLRLPPTYRGLGSVAASDDDVAWLAGRERSTDDAATLVGRLSGEDFEVLPALPGIVRESTSIDVGRGEIVGTTLRGSIFRLDPNGELLSTSTVAFHVRDADTGVDGTTVLVSDDGDVALLAAGASRAEPLPSIVPRPGDPAFWPEVAVWNRDRIVVAGPDNQVRLLDGGSWRVIVDDPRIEAEAVAIDATRVLVQGARLEVAILDDERGEWTSYGELAFLVANAITATALGDGRFFLAGQSGHAAYFNGEKLCALGKTVDRNLGDVSASPTGRVVYAVGGNDGEGTPPAVVRYEVP